MSTLRLQVTSTSNIPINYFPQRKLCMFIYILVILPSVKLSGTLATSRHRNQIPFRTWSKASATSTTGSKEGSSANTKEACNTLIFQIKSLVLFSSKPILITVKKVLSVCVVYCVKYAIVQKQATCSSWPSTMRLYEKNT